MTKKEEKNLATSFFSHTIAPVMLIIWSSTFAMAIVYLVVVHKSSLQTVAKYGTLQFLIKAWTDSLVFDLEVAMVIAGMCIWSAISLIALGGETYFGPFTTTGHRPQYVKSGCRYYVASLLILGVVLPNISAFYWYSKYHIIISHLIIFGYVITILLYIKGRICPSPGEYGSSGNIIFDYYWGLELYPRLGERFDLKQWTNCRFGMMTMQIVALLCWKAQIEYSGWNWAMAATTILQTLYLAKFYWWEDGYMNTIDIKTDRAGYYICWGCLCFVPSFYTLTNLYMVEHSPEMNFANALFIVVLGILMIALNYWSDYQKQIVLSTDGKCTIWGKPPNIIRTTYQDITGTTRHGMLLASGFWGLAHHLNYTFEILLHFCWELPALFYSPLPYFHGIFLTILLVHRAYRDDVKCKQKYGEFWDCYCKLCPYMMIPGIF